MKFRFRSALITLIVASSVFGNSLLFTPVSSSATTQPAALLALTIRDAIASKWVHVVILGKQDGFSVKEVDDIGSDEGRQFSSISDGETFEIIGFNSSHRAYFRANKLGLDGMGLAKNAEAKDANKWLEITPSNSNYATTVSSTTLSLIVDQDLKIIGGHLTFGPIISFDGRHVREIKGTIPANKYDPKLHAILYVTTTSAPLPVGMFETGKGFSASGIWSKWGVVVTLIAPKHSTLLSKSDSK